MGRRRQFGSVRKLASGRWQARYRTSGGRSITAPSTFPSKAEAGRWLAATETDLARRLWLDPEAGKVLLGAYAWAWLRGQARLAKRTREIYETQLRLHVLPAIDAEVPALGEIALGDLTPEVVRQWYAALVAARGQSVAAKAYTRLRQILTRAVEDERIARNPCRVARGGVERHPEQRFASIPELYGLAAAVPAQYRTLVLTAGLAGLREGELFGLRWRDVDLEDGSITVRRKRLRLASGEVIEEDPKSDAGRRKVALPATLVDELVQHRVSHRPSAEPDDYVFVSPTGEPLERSNFRHRVWLPATRSIGLEGLRFHDLRHTAGTLAARTGATTKELMARLGHASPRASLSYQPPAEDPDRRVAERLDEMTAEAGVDRAAPAADRRVPLPSGTDVARRRGTDLLG
jgi:integrase